MTGAVGKIVWADIVPPNLHADEPFHRPCLRARNAAMRDARARDHSAIGLWTACRLPGELSAGVADVHTHPTLPRAARVTLQIIF